jgi:hypothetical protein
VRSESYGVTAQRKPWMLILNAICDNWLGH